MSVGVKDIKTGKAATRVQYCYQIWDECGVPGTFECPARADLPGENCFYTQIITFWQIVAAKGTTGYCHIPLFYRGDPFGSPFFSGYIMMQAAFGILVPQRQVMVIYCIRSQYCLCC